MKYTYKYNVYENDPDRTEAEKYTGNVFGSLYMLLAIITFSLGIYYMVGLGALIVGNGILHFFISVPSFFVSYSITMMAYKAAMKEKVFDKESCKSLCFIFLITLLILSLITCLICSYSLKKQGSPELFYISHAVLIIAILGVIGYKVYDELSWRLHFKKKEKIKKKLDNITNEENLTNLKQEQKVNHNNISAMDALYCRKCGAKIPSDSLFCSKCGEKVLL